MPNRRTPMQANEYEPWKELGETELAYYKRLHLEERAENGRLREVLIFCKAWMAGTRIDDLPPGWGHVNDALNEVLRKP